MNIMDYILQNKNKKTWRMNEVEALILAQSSYFNFERFQQTDMHFPMTLSNFLKEAEIPEVDGYMLKKNYRLIKAMFESQRYQSLVILDAESDLNHQLEVQFAAVTYQINSRTLFVAYRGTDSSVTGWKDDFNMTFEHDTQTQIEARRYLQKIQEQHPKAHIYVGGHSKGGNIAVYASAHSIRSHQIKKVFDFDGPGFHEDFLKGDAYASIKTRIHKFIPQSSIIGLMLKSDEHYTIVKSKEFSIYQHDPYNWQVENHGFVVAQGLSESSLHLQKTLTLWLNTVDTKRRMQIIDAFFRILQDMEIEYFSDIKKAMSFSTVKYLLDSYGNLDESLRKDTFRFFRKFVQIGVMQFAEDANPFKNFDFDNDKP